MSLEAAAEIVTEKNLTVDRFGLYVWSGGEWSLQTAQPTSSVEDVKKAFRQYRPVAHILAAGLVASHYMELMTPFDRSDEADKCFFSTVIAMQARLRKVSNFADWGLWEITAPLPYDPREYPPFEFPPEMVHDLMVPWLDKTRGT